MTPSEIRAYYSRPEILARLFEMSRGREVIPVFRDGIYGRRPNSVQFPADILYFAKNGAVSFHCSVEHWKNPSALSNDMKRRDLDAMRTGWDFVLDIDSDAGIEVAKITAKLLIEEMQKNGVKNISVKFSGRRGFHIGIPFGAFPDVVNIEPTAAQFPSLAQKIAQYLKASIREKLAQEIISLDSALKARITDGTRKNYGNATQSVVLTQDGTDPYAIVEVEDNWSVRHLFRMPYSLNEKTWRISIPIDPARIMEFSPDEAEPNAVLAKTGFLERFQKGEASKLIQKAIEFEGVGGHAYAAHKSQDEEKEKLRKHLTDGSGTIVFDAEKMRKPPGMPRGKDEGSEGGSGAEYMLGGIREGKRSYSGARVPEEYFPPCIKKILGGLSDGRKRAIFILINFFRSVGYGWDEIDKKLAEWNAKNAEPVSESYIKGQFEYAKKHDKKIPPPNCSNAGYYKDIKVCVPDNYCAAVKNPAGYAGRRALTASKPRKRVLGRIRKKGSHAGKD